MSVQKDYVIGVTSLGGEGDDTILESIVQKYAEYEDKVKKNTVLNELKNKKQIMVQFRLYEFDLLVRVIPSTIREQCKLCDLVVIVVSNWWTENRPDDISRAIKEQTKLLKGKMLLVARYKGKEKKEERLDFFIDCAFMEVNESNSHTIFDRSLILLMEGMRKAKRKTKKLGFLFMHSRSESDSTNGTGDEFMRVLNMKNPDRDYALEDLSIDGDVDSIVEKIDVFLERGTNVLPKENKILVQLREIREYLSCKDPPRTPIDVSMKRDKLLRLFTQVRVKEDRYFTVGCKFFGKPFEQIPDFLIKAIRFIEMFGITQEGLFRKSPRKLEYQEYRNALLAGKTVRFKRVKNIHVVPSLVKDFFREMPKSPLPIDQFLDCYDVENSDMRLIAFQKQVFRLESLQFALLKLLFSFFKKIASHSSENKMKESNLAIVFAPSLVQMNVNVENAKEIVDKSIKILTFMITNVDFLFNSESYEEGKFLFNDEVWKNTKVFIEKKFEFLFNKVLEGNLKKVGAHSKNVDGLVRKNNSYVERGAESESDGLKEENAKFEKDVNGFIKKMKMYQSLLLDKDLDKIFRLVLQLDGLKKNADAYLEQVLRVQNRLIMHNSKMFDPKQFQLSEVFKKYRSTFEVLKEKSNVKVQKEIEIEDYEGERVYGKLKQEIDTLKKENKNLSKKMKTIEVDTKKMFYPVCEPDIKSFFRNVKKVAAKSSRRLTLPPVYVCPLSKQLMKNPVVLVDSGNSYEKGALEEYLVSNFKDPVTGKILKTKMFCQNVALKKLIDIWREEQMKI